MTAGLAQEVAAAVGQLRQITVQVRTHGAATGAGILWNAGESEGRGLVITNAHVVQGDRATITLGDGTVARARVVARDLKRDLAALEFEPRPAMLSTVIRDSGSVIWYCTVVSARLNLGASSASAASSWKSRPMKA